MTERILIAGIGNIFRGDDAFGVEVAQALLARPLPAGVRVVDFGIRGFDLTCALMDGYELTILVDATARGGVPGTLYTIEPDLNDPREPDAGPAEMETHSLNPARVFRVVKSMGGACRRVLMVGCEPETLGSEEEGAMGLSAPVQAAIEPAVRLIESLVDRALAGTLREAVSVGT